MSEAYFSAATVADVLSVSKRTIERWAHWGGEGRSRLQI